MRDSLPNLLLIHGAGGGGWEWDLWRGVLQARGFACHAPDLQPAADGLTRTRLADYVRQMRDVLQELPQPRAVIGASLGGLLAAMLAADADSGIDALVLVNALPPAPWHVGLPARDWPPRVPWGRDARLQSTRRAMPDADPATALHAFRRWRDESGQVLRDAHAGIDIARPQARTLCIVGGADADVPAAAGIDWARTWSADLEVVADAGHLSPLFGRDATACAGRVADWLSAR